MFLDNLDMTKYDYAKILVTFKPREFEMFSTLSTNEEYVARRIYNATKNEVAGCSTMFLTTGNKFEQWLTFYSPENQDYSYLDTLIIGHIHRYPTWASVYNGDTRNIEQVLNYLIASWTNTTKTLKVNMNALNMLYQRYVRFLNTERGQEFAYAKSLDLITDAMAMEEGAYYEDKMFYEQYSYREEQLIKFKKNILLKNCKDAMENVQMRAIWDVTFEGKKFNISSAIRLIRKEIPDTVISDVTLNKQIKRLRVEMLKQILAHVDEYFNADQLFELNGKVVNIKTAIMVWLNNAEVDYSLELANRIPNLTVVEYVINWCNKHGLPYSTRDKNSSILIKVKGDSTGCRKSSWKLYVKKGGGFIDYRNGVTGYYTNLD